MKTLAQKFQLQAQLLIVENRYSEAKEAYKQMIQYDRSYDSLFEYAHFLQKQNHFKEATREYENILVLELSQDHRATTLNNLAILYRAQNQNQEALKAYEEALGIRRELAKKNPTVYEIDYAKMLIMGVDYFERDKKDLEEAKDILSQERYREVYQAQKLLKQIEEIEKQ